MHICTTLRNNQGARNTRVCTGYCLFSNHIIRNWLNFLKRSATFEAATIVHSMKNTKVPPVLKEKQHICAQPCTCSVAPIIQHTKIAFFSFIYLPIRILMCKTWRIAPKTSCLRLKPWWVWRTTAMERRISRIQRAGTHQPSPSLCALPQNGMLFFTKNSLRLLIFVFFFYKSLLDHAISQQKCKQ